MALQRGYSGGQGAVRIKRQANVQCDIRMSIRTTVIDGIVLFATGVSFTLFITSEVLYLHCPFSYFFLPTGRFKLPM